MVEVVIKISKSFSESFFVKGKIDNNSPTLTA